MADVGPCDMDFVRSRDARPLILYKSFECYSSEFVRCTNRLRKNELSVSYKRRENKTKQTNLVKK